MKKGILLLLAIIPLTLSANFNVESLTEEAGMSSMHLDRKIMGLFGQSPGDFLRTIHLKR